MLKERCDRPKRPLEPDRCRIRLLGVRRFLPVTTANMKESNIAGFASARTALAPN